MHATYSYPRFAYQRPPELDQPQPTRRPVVVVGAGPVGLSAATELALRGQPVLLLDEDDTVSVGSRGLCYAKRTLEILDRQGCGQPVVDKGVTWNIGRTFWGTDEVFHFNLLPEPGHERPGMVNLQQYYLEQYQIARARELPALEMRFRHQVTGVTAQGDGALLQVQTPDGSFTLACDWLLVCDGARSPVRRMLGLDIDGKVFQDRFLIADVLMDALPRQAAAAASGCADGLGHERWFWFDPPFHPGQSVLLHREADQVWRIDFQLGWDADPEEEKKPEKVSARIRAMLGADHPFTLEWVSVYTFQCRRMARFRHGRVLFAGDSAHQVSPFGARGANSGIQDVDNLGWKLKAVIDGVAPPALLDSYSDERCAAADENILNSTRSTDFITPKSAASRRLRQAVLGLARQHAFARALVNSGRLSVPSTLADSPLNTPDDDPAAFVGWMVPGAPLDDAPVLQQGRPGWLLRALAAAPSGLAGDSLGAAGSAAASGACGFALLVFGALPAGLPALRAAAPVPLRVLRVLDADQADAHDSDGDSAADRLVDAEGLVAQRLDARPGTVYLLRPDQHVAARWRRFDAGAVQAALCRALCLH